MFGQLPQNCPESWKRRIITMESEAFEDLQKGGGALRAVKDLGAGAAGGMAQVLLGMCWIYCN